jgi:hypothetical protein
LSKSDFAEAAFSIDFFSPAVACLKRGSKENQSQKFALSVSDGFSALLPTALSAQPEGRW